MPRRKQKAAAVDEEVAPAKKRVKREVSDDSCTIEGISIQWEWEGDKGEWTAYAEDLNEDIIRAFNDEKKELELAVPGGAQIKIVLGKMVQKNKKTGWERRLRCCVMEDEDPYSWEWEDEKKKWNPYLVQPTIDLENARLANQKSYSLEAFGRNYTINLGKLEQANDDTGIVRKVRRVQSDCTKPPPVENQKATASTARSSRARSAPSTATSVKAETAKSSGKSGRKVAKSARNEENKVKTVVLKGKAPVDGECPKADSAHIFSEGSDIYDAMLNQTNLSDNNNKYYLCQLLEDDNKKSYSVWFRWGRVGKNGQNSLMPYGPNLDAAKKTFCSKFKDKTKNDWYDRKNFVKIQGKYDVVQLDYSANGTDDVDSKPGAREDVPDSKLHPKLQDLINLICDVKSMEDAVIEMKYDARKAPLGKLKTEQIKAGYAALKKIDACIAKNDLGNKLIQACDEFYTRIPHDFGMSRPPVIRNKADLKLKIQLLEALADIEIAMNILKHSDTSENPVDTHYKDLKCDIRPLGKSDADFNLVEDYLQNTHASSHNQYKMEIQNVFELNKKGEADQFIDQGNKYLLWHGSRLTNWMGILSQGLRIAPPEAPVTGYMFGKGVYFADMSSKSANYCYPTKAKNEGLVLLCEVSLGKTNDLLSADYEAASMPAGKHSVWGKGKIAPDPSKNFVMPNGTVVPVGKPKDTGVNNPKGYTLNYNEFIVYDVRQIRVKYMVHLKFNFK